MAVGRKPITKFLIVHAQYAHKNIGYGRLIAGKIKLISLCCAWVTKRGQLYFVYILLSQADLPLSSSIEVQCGQRVASSAMGWRQYGQRRGAAFGGGGAMRLICLMTMNTAKVTIRNSSTVLRKAP